MPQATEGRLIGDHPMREIERFKARSADGAYETTIIVYQDFVDAGTRGNRDAVEPGRKKARTIEGYACNCLPDGTFEVVNDPRHPGVILHRVE